jgi:hypothetical protein
MKPALPARRREQIKTSPIGCTIAEAFKNLEFSAIVLRRICIMVFDQSGIRFSTWKIFAWHREAAGTTMWQHDRRGDVPESVAGSREANAKIPSR